MSRIPPSFEGFLDGRHLVWARFIRVFHWGLVVSVTTALVSGFLLESTWIRLHMISAVFDVAIVTARIVCGFTSPAYARFAQFLPSDRQVVSHLKVDAPHARHVRHNPLGALMVFAPRLLIIGLGLTGTAALGSGLKTGPLAASLLASLGPIWTELHELVGFALLGLAAISISLLVAGAVIDVDSLSQRPLTQLPVEPLAQIYVDECAACHMANPAGFLPQRSWTKIMTTLDDHFGENTTLGEACRAEIKSYLVQNAADAGGRPSGLLSRVAPDETLLRISEMPWFSSEHDGEVSSCRLKKAESMAHCAACHRGADREIFEDQVMRRRCIGHLRHKQRASTASAKAYDVFSFPSASPDQPQPSGPD